MVKFSRKLTQYELVSFVSELASLESFSGLFRLPFGSSRFFQSLTLSAGVTPIRGEILMIYGNTRFASAPTGG